MSLCLIFFIFFKMPIDSLTVRICRGQWQILSGLIQDILEWSLEFDSHVIYVIP